MEQFILISALAAYLTVCPQSSAEEESMRYASALPVAVACDNEEAERAAKAGMLDLMLGWEESATDYFARALEKEPRCTLAHAGEILLRGDHGEHLEKLRANLESLISTPAEDFYLAAFLKWAANDRGGCVKDFAQRADTFRADKPSTLWCIFLSYLLTETRDDAVVRAIQLYERFPNDAVVCYARAYVEQNAEEVSDEAMEAAEKSVRLMPDHPMTHHLCGHLLYRRGEYKKAAECFNHAAILASERKLPLYESSQWWISRLYESTALYADGNSAAALKIRRALNSIPIDKEHRYSRGTVFHRWEANTLPLRVLVAAKSSKLTLGAISAASDAATPKPALEQDTVILVRDCLRATLHARLHATKGKLKYAVRSLNIAEKALTDFEKTQETTVADYPMEVTPWMRAHEACVMALNIARAEIYTDTADIWREKVSAAKQPSVLLLPPAIPARHAD